MIGRAFAAIGLAIGLLGGGAAANAVDCPGNPNALGTSRVLTIDPAQYPRIGTIQYPQTLPLADKEVVLTFDDGPLPPYTTRILEILAAECVKANYFIIGRMARGYPALVRRVRAEGHVIGTHSENHPLAFDKMPLHTVQNEIEQGIASTAGALGDRNAVAPFFRIPGLLRSDAVENHLRSRRLVTFGADIPGDDWRHISASEVVRRTISRLDEKGRGIILLHDIQPATALALPQLLRELKSRGYRIVQVAPAAPAPMVAAAPRQAAPVAAKPAPLPDVALAAAPWPTTVPLPQPPVAAPPPPAPGMAANAATVEPIPQSAPERALPAPADLLPAPVADSMAQGQPTGLQVTRPLTPGLKPSHGTVSSGKISELQPAPQQPAQWSRTANGPVPAKVDPNQWPLTAASLHGAR